MKRSSSGLSIRKAVDGFVHYKVVEGHLRSDSDALTRQALLGQKYLEMVKRYARVAKIALQRTHGRASPVDNWRL
jgi:hypothetical protein